MPEDSSGLQQTPQLVAGKAPAPSRPPSTHMRTAAMLEWWVRGINPQSWFGSGAGQPQSVPEEARGRQMDYAPLYNLRIRPKDEGASIPQLRGLATDSVVIQGAIRTVIKQLQRLKGTIQKVGAKKYEPQDETALRIQSFFQRPDREHDFATWWGALIEDQLTCDGPCLYAQRDKYGDVQALEHIDPATIMRQLSSSGRTPFPPEPAYKQILKGQPMYYTMDEMLYYPRFPASWRIYGYGEVEQCVVTANIAIRRDYHKLEYYRSGSVPDCFVVVPPDTGPDALKKFQQDFDSAMGGDLERRRHVRFLPAGTGAITLTKESVLKDEYDDLLMRLACWFFDISPQALVRETNKGTGTTQKELSFEEGMESRMAYWGAFFNECIRRFFRTTEYEWRWELEVNGNREIEAKADQLLYFTGLRTLNQLLEDHGKPPVPDGQGGDERIVVVGNQIYRVADLPTIKPPSAAPPAGPGDQLVPGGGDEPDPKAGPASGNSRAAPDRLLAKQGSIPTSAEMTYHHDTDEAHVNEIAADMKAHGYDGPPILIANNSTTPYLLDGHHRFTAAKQAGLEQVPALIVDRGELDALLKAKFNGEMPAKLSELDAYIELPSEADYGDMRKVSLIRSYQKKGQPKHRIYPSPVTAKGRKAEAKLKDAFLRLFKAKGPGIVKAMCAKFPARNVAKIDGSGSGPDPVMMPHEGDDILSILDGMDWSVVEGEAKAALAESGQAQGTAVIAQLGIEDKAIASTVNEATVSYAGQRAGGLITDIDETTRSMAREMVRATFANKESEEQLAERLSTLFSEDRAALIARQEMRMANTGADYAAWRAAGIEGKIWLLSNDHDEDDDCDSNADQGVIPLGQAFESGDMYPPQHINCVCSWAAAELDGG